MSRLCVSAMALIVLSCACSDRASTAAPSSPNPPPSPIAYDPPQYRALWVDAFHDGMKSPAQVEKLVGDAHRANLNALIVQVRKAGDAYFNRSDEPRATDITGPPDFDPLAYVIKLAHAAVPHRGSCLAQHVLRRRIKPGLSTARRHVGQPGG